LEPLLKPPHPEHFIKTYTGEEGAFTFVTYPLDVKNVEVISQGFAGFLSTR
jgi:hypothetical protein